MKNLVKQEFDDAKITKFVDDGINQTCYFKPNPKSNQKSESDIKYVAKIYSSELMDINDYLGVTKVAYEYVHNGDYLNVPEIHSFGVYNDKAYVIYEYIHGDPLEFTAVYDADEMEYYIDRVGKIMAELHEQENPVDNFGWFSVENESICLKDGYSDSLGLLLRQFDHSLNKIGESEFISKYEDKMRDLIRRHINYNSKPSICHCDIKYSNLINSGDSEYLIDWEFIRSADPLYDLVKAERQFFSRFSRGETITDKKYRRYRDLLHSSYFNSSKAEFDQDRYIAYWLVEMVESLSDCEDGYNEDQLSYAEEYYKNKIKKAIQELE